MSDILKERLLLLEEIGELGEAVLGNPYDQEKFRSLLKAMLNYEDEFGWVTNRTELMEALAAFTTEEMKH